MSDALTSDEPALQDRAIRGKLAGGSFREQFPNEDELQAITMREHSFWGLESHIKSVSRGRF